MRNILITLLFFCLGAFWSARPVAAAGYGVHILHPEEIQDVAEGTRESRGEQKVPLFVTLPFSLEDIHRLDRWQASFAVAKKENIVPLVRLVTRFDTEKNAWVVPNQYEIVQLANALSTLSWPQEERHIILFNEPNHAAEWGGEVNPESYAEVALFAAQWFNTEPGNYVVLPAAADLAAPNGNETMEAFAFWRQALSNQPGLLEQLDAWNSHSYPNPGFMASPYRKGKNSLRGFEHELDFLALHSDRQWPVYITETGWKQTTSNVRQMASYYEYAGENIWNNEQVVAVTPFLWQGIPGPFAAFSLQNEERSFTYQGEALLRLISQSAATLLSDTSAGSAR